MIKNLFKTHPERWLTLGLLVLATLILAFTGGDGDVDSAHYPHPTPTLTPPPPLQACQVKEIFFDDQLYTPGTTITATVGVLLKVTLRVADAQGAPLIGANVDATVTQTTTVHAAAIPPLEDQSGTYDGVFTPENAGLHIIKFSASDFTGPRFLPCSAEAKVRVEPPPLPPCQIYDVLPVEGTKIPRNQPFTVTARVRVEGVEQCNANVNTIITKPGGSTDGPRNFGGSCPYTLTYTDTSSVGEYTFDISASDPNEVFASCRLEPPRKVKVVDPPCEISLQAGPSPLKLESVVGLTATLTNTVCANGVNANIQIPGNGTVTIPLIGTANICTAPYTPPVTGTYTITARANSPGGTCQSISPNNIIVEPTLPSTPTIQIKLPASPIDLCGRGPDITGTIAVNNVVNLTGTQLEVSYDPTFIQVIDAFGRPRPPVQVKPDANFDPFLRNEVDTRRGKIFFTANARTPVTGSGNVIYIDWRLQGRTGTTPITVVAVVTDASGTRNVTQVASMTFIIDSTCVQGTVNLQGRADHSGVTVTASGGQQTQSYPTGLFAIAAAEPLHLTFPAYLPGQMDVLPGAVGTPESLGIITLLAGDMNGDNVVDILDLANLAQRYQSTDPTADLNADGIVDILDLALVAGNYQRQGPLTVGQ